MRVKLYDKSGHAAAISRLFDISVINQPMVTERRDRFSFFHGDGELTQLAFSGIYIVYGDMIMMEKKRLFFELQTQHHLVEMHFSLDGTGVVKNRITGRRYEFRPNQTNMHYTPAFSGQGDFNPHERYRFFEVHFTREFFFELAKDTSPLLQQFAERMSSTDGEVVRDTLPITLEMHQCIRDIMHCRVTGGLKLLFLQSKCIELLALQAQAYEEAARQPSKLLLKSDYDKECIYFARTYLLEHVQDPPSLTELAKIAGTNEFKLKQGFKELFNATVFGLLTDYRLSQAKDLLLEKKTIKAVADELGYSSVQHFSTAFRKKYGMPPGKLK